jgi:hypothetical protein
VLSNKRRTERKKVKEGMPRFRDSLIVFFSSVLLLLKPYGTAFVVPIQKANEKAIYVRIAGVFNSLLWR